jgi:replicative DNA helicase
MNYQEAELFTMGGLIAIPENFDKARGKVSASDFENPIFSKAFAILEEIDQTESMPFDRTTIKAGLLNHLTENEILVFERTIEGDIGANESLPYWVDQVKRGSVERKIRAAVKEGISSDCLDSLLRELSSLDHPEKLYQPLNQIPSVKIQGTYFKTGFTDIDHVLKFGPGHVMVIAGKTGLGKTSLGVQIIDFISYERPAGIISLEMTGGELRDRVENSFGTLSKNIFISDPSSCSSVDFAGICKTLKSEQGVEVVLLDYLQLLRERQDYRGRHLEISHIIRRIKEVAKELKLAVIVVSQISRGIDARGRGSLPSLADLKESGDIEFAADEVLFIHQPEPGDKDFSGDNVKLLLISKNRWGKQGKLKLYWDGNKTKFENFYRGDDES